MLLMLLLEYSCILNLCRGLIILLLCKYMIVYVLLSCAILLGACVYQELMSVYLWYGVGFAFRKWSTSIKWR